MRNFGLTVLGLGLAAVGFAQTGRTYSSPGGFGNILYPGTGHAPNAPTGQPYRGGYPGNAPRANHPAHGRTAVVPYPVIVGGYYPMGYGYGYGYDPGAPPAGYQEPGQTSMYSNGVPSVVINQTFIPDRAVPIVREYGAGPEGPPPPDQPGMRTYEGLRTQPQPEPSARRASDQPTLYLIAFKDHHIVPALGYWVEGGNLHYVSAEHSLNQASLDLIDRDMSQQLNDERHVEFRLPKP